MSDRPCTCHPSEAPTPCQKRYALTECQAARIEQLEAALRTIRDMGPMTVDDQRWRVAKDALDNDASQRKAALDRLIEIDGEFL